MAVKELELNKQGIRFLELYKKGFVAKTTEDNKNNLQEYKQTVVECAISRQNNFYIDVTCLVNDENEILLMKDKTKKISAEDVRLLISVKPDFIKQLSTGLFVKKNLATRKDMVNAVNLGLEDYLTDMLIEADRNSSLIETKIRLEKLAEQNANKCKETLIKMIKAAKQKKTKLNSDFKQQAAVK